MFFRADHERKTKELEDLIKDLSEKVHNDVKVS